MAANPVAPTATAGLTTAEGQYLTSYDDFERYPLNLLVQNCSEATLRTYATKLSARSDTWFGPEDRVFIPICELNATKNSEFRAKGRQRNGLTMIGWIKFNVLNETRLQEWLGDVHTTTTGAPTSTTACQWKFSKSDPRCRFV